MKPGPVLFAAALCLFVMGAAGFFFDPLVFFWYITAAALFPLIVIDALVLALCTDRLSAERETGGALALGRKTVVRLLLRRTGRGILARSIRLFDIYPDGLYCGAPHEGASVFPARLDRRLLRGRRGTAQRGPARTTLTFEYPVIPISRGPWEFERTELLLGSPLGCWRLKVVHPCISRGRTFPDFQQLASGSDLRGVLEQTGIKVIRKRGQGMEFMNLRDYQKGDSVKAIDWRATGRRGKPIVREYREEQDQQVLFLLDSGYRLHRLEEAASKAPYRTAPETALPMASAVPTGSAAPADSALLRTQFDSALEASLILSWVALKHGDAAALGCFGAEERWLPPRKGMNALASLTRSLYDVKSAPAPSSLFSALEQALGRLKRRSFIIMISNFREEDGESLSWILRRIQRRHLLLLVSLKEAEAEALAKRRPREKDEALESAAAFSYLSERRRLYKTWEHLGLLTLECSSRELSAALINRYLEVKRSGLL